MRANMLSSKWDTGVLEWGDSGEGGVGCVRVIYMNAGKGVNATHEYLERCARGGVGIAFVGECWVERKSDKGTESHPDYVRLGTVSGGAKVAYHVSRSVADCCSLVSYTNRFVCVNLGSVRFGEVYSKCGASVHEMSGWLESIQGSIVGGWWILIGDWNAHHSQ